jgi:D-serine deaminase-like pyridoxal phosphate-dependent protein
MTAGGAFRLTAAVDTPALLVDMDIFEANLAEMATIVRGAGIDLVPHVKTHRTVDFGLKQLELGANGVSVATMDEAEAFVRAGARRIVYAYPLVSEAKIHRALRLSTHTDLTVATDSLEGASAIGRIFAAAGLRAQTYLIVDSGLHRCGVAPSDAIAIAIEISLIAGIELTGIMTHEGSVYGSPDADQLRENSLAVARQMVETAESIRSVGIPLRTVSLGASASVRTVATFPGVTEVRPGMYAFNDLAQIGVGTATPETCAARVLATVVSHPAFDRAYIDAGSKSLSKDAPPGIGAAKFPGYGRVVDHPGWQIVALSEEHGWLRWTGDGSPTVLNIGQQVQVIPNHICTVFSSLGESIGLRDGTIVGRWNTIPRTVELPAD